MVRQRITKDITADGGGEGSATGNVLVWYAPDKYYGVLKKIAATNRTGADGNLLLDDQDLASDLMAAIAPVHINVKANNTVTWDEEDIGNLVLHDGIIVQASNGAIGTGWKVTVEIEVD